MKVYAQRVTWVVMALIFAAISRCVWIAAQPDNENECYTFIEADSDCLLKARDPLTPRQKSPFERAFKENTDKGD